MKTRLGLLASRLAGTVVRLLSAQIQMLQTGQASEKIRGQVGESIVVQTQPAQSGKIVKHTLGQ